MVRDTGRVSVRVLKTVDRGFGTTVPPTSGEGTLRK